MESYTDKDKPGNQDVIRLVDVTMLRQDRSTVMIGTQIKWINQILS
jgi:hypothetical protein